MISITKNGLPLGKSSYNYDEKTNTLSTFVNGVVIDAGDYATIKTGDNSTIDAGSYATIDTGYNAMIKAMDNSTIKTGDNATIDAGENSVVIRRDLFDVIIFKVERKITICPYNIPGYVENEIYSVTGRPAIIADVILSEIINKRKTKNTTVYNVLNHGEINQSYLVDQDGIFSHGNTIKEAKDGLVYKIGSRDASAYNDFTLETEITLEESIKMYRVITGACEPGTRYFVERQNNIPEKFTVQEVIKITEGQYNHNVLVNFFKKGSEK
jgi:hypothetical protein